MEWSLRPFIERSHRKRIYVTIFMDKETTYEEMNHQIIRGIVQSGAGKGSYFTQVDWVVEQCNRMLGYKPFPGTLNVQVAGEDLKHLDSFLRESDFELVPDDPAFCSARVKKVMVNNIPGALILPAEDVRIHEEGVIEIIAACSIKETLGIGDGDLVTVAAA
jgi:riboflavin kinase